VQKITEKELEPVMRTYQLEGDVRVGELVFKKTTKDTREAAREREGGKKNQKTKEESRKGKCITNDRPSVRRKFGCMKRKD